MILLLVTLLFLRITIRLSAQPCMPSVSPGMMEYIKAFGIGLCGILHLWGYQQTINFGAKLTGQTATYPGNIFRDYHYYFLYLLINYAYVRVIGFEELKASKNIAAIMASPDFWGSCGTDIVRSAISECPGLCQCALIKQSTGDVCDERRRHPAFSFPPAECKGALPSR